MRRVICDGAGAGICDGAPSTCSSRDLFLVYQESVRQYTY